MTFSFHPEAEIEFLEAVDYYEESRQRLGYDFASEIYSTIDRIISFPEAWPIIKNDIRRCLTKRFPYGVVYSIEDDSIFIISIMHLHRKPNYWTNRI